MKRPDISGMSTNKAWQEINHALFELEPSLKPGHCVRFSLCRYPEQKRTFTNMPVIAIVNSILGAWSSNSAIDRTKQQAFAKRLRGSSIMAVLVTGPIVSSPQYALTRDRMTATRLSCSR